MPSTRTDKCQLPKTGWSTSYVTGGGDDGDIQAGSPILPRFIDNGDNTITDRVTNRQWIKQPELLIPDGLNASNIGVAKGLWAANTSYLAGDIADKASDYSAWICLVAHTSINPPSFANAISYSSGDVVLDAAGDGTYYQCGANETSNAPLLGTIAEDITNGGSWTQVATDVGSLFDFDRTTNPSYWSKSIWGADDGSGNLVPSQMPCDNADSGGANNGATEACKALTKAGKSDWYLPNITELLSLVDYSQVSPAINAAMFPNIRTDNYYWTSTPYAGYRTYYAWVVNFGDGVTYSNYRNGNGYVRPVRQY
jgi:hypothetical protein